MTTAQMATYPARENILPMAVNSLINQVDRMNVMLNAYDHIPECCKHPKIQTQILDNAMTDGAKFFGIENVKGYVFTVDDDIIYPPDYIQKSIEAIEKYNRKYIITYHGRVWNPLPITSFYRDRAAMYRAIEGFEGDHIVQCGGDGVMAWHSDTFQMRYDYVEGPDMSQTWMALACNAAGVKQIAIGHPLGWLKPIDLDIEDTIWYRQQADGVQTKLINSRWKSM